MSVHCLKFNFIYHSVCFCAVCTIWGSPEFDYIIVMEEYNLPRLFRIIGDDPENKVSKMLDFTNIPGDIEDPWYSGNFEKVFEQITLGCKGILEKL